MAEIPLSYLYAKVEVEPYAGTGAYGDTYEASRTRPCAIEDRRQLVRDNDGREVISETTLTIRREHLADFPPGSRVHTHHGRVAYVIVAAEHRDGGRGAWQHGTVNLT
ncbi:hypothetical protein D9V41_09220 [Aeromicrobium phragmitis]|uniref:Head-to-tail stopper n=1 Tax=Aeromicrobium phragmitis TaxID=2478914 RepID=A0A3L8PNG1_9ACTN|nr:hypothetical protein [Aeromicrobium phragmitis]RLV56058.1 hypothetical protein D9V41_09220 [Aeromicrobium phragmitis]